MSITAGYLILLVILVRMVLKNTYKTVLRFWWGLVGLRLILPYSVKSIFSLIPAIDVVSSDSMNSNVPLINSGIDEIDSLLSSAVEHIHYETPFVEKFIEDVLSVLPYIWFVVVIVLWFYMAIAWVKVWIKTREAIEVGDNVWICDKISSAIVFGIFRPRIFIPSIASEHDIPYILQHEKAHLKYHDHIWKPLSFMIASIYWFNPLVWLAYFLFCRDIEFSCDEYAVAEKEIAYRKAYSNALISCSCQEYEQVISPFFGRNYIKKRVETVLSYKARTHNVVISFVLILLALAMFLTDPVIENDMINGTHDLINTEYSYSTENDISKIVFYENDEFLFSQSLLSGQLLIGKYEFDNGYVTLLVDDGRKYVFKSTGKGLAFEANRSSAVPIFRYSSDDENPKSNIVDGCVFSKVD